MNLVLTKRADRDLDEIQSYYEIAQGFSEWIAKQLEDAFEHILRWPQTGHHWLELLSSAYLFLAVTPYRIVYMIQGDHLIVVTIRHGARDLNKLANLLP